MKLLLRPFLILLLASFLTTSATWAQSRNLTGHWSGAIDVPGSSLGIEVDFQDDATFSGTIEIPAQKMKGVVLKDPLHRGDSVFFAIPNIPGDPTFKGAISEDGIEVKGTFLQGGAELTFSLKRVTEADRKEEVAATDSALASIRSFITSAIREWDVPGLAIAIVRDDSVIMSEGFGYRDLEQKLPVTPTTLFAIGSSTKAFTATLVGMLVDEGKIEWDKPVINYLPQFRLKDEYATSHITPRDLLTHVSGLPRHDVIWYFTPLKREDVLDRLRYLEPSAELRTKWQYQNLMFMTAGYMAGVVDGTSWEEMLQKRILAPLGMTSTNTYDSISEANPDHALPYGKGETEVKLLPFHPLDAIGPAGSINSNVVDMAQWVRFNLSDGTFNKKKLLSGRILKALHSPQVVMPGGGKDKEILFPSYGMGWMISAYRGHNFVEHGGNIDGFSAMVSFLPDDNMGIVILTNMNGTPLPELVLRTAYDRLLGVEPKDWSGPILKQIAAMKDTDGEDDVEDVARVPDTKPSHPLEDYVGDYEHPAYGRISITLTKGNLRAGYWKLNADLEHYHYDVFALASSEGNEAFAGTRFSFFSDIGGTIDRIQVPFEPSIAPIEFLRVASASMSDSTVLAKYTGDYDLGTTLIHVRQEKGKLFAAITGQGEIELLPKAEHLFTLKGLKGFTMRFTLKKDHVISLASIQPNGTFVAKRR